MVKYSFAELGQWARKTQKRTDIIVKQSVNDLTAGIEVAPGITRGGSRKKGTIPRDLGALAASLKSSLNGSTSFTGAESAVLVAGSMKAGDVAHFSWGGAVAPYAAAVHYGARGVQGTFWIDVAANKWPQYVDAATKRAIAQVG